MIYLNNFSIPSSYDEIWLVGLRIDPDNESHDFFTIIFSGENNDIPLTVDNYIVLFDKVDLLNETIENSKININKTFDILKIETIDIAKALYLINTGDIDNFTTIVDSLNIILDLVKTVRISVPNTYKLALFKVVDYFTFSKDISKFFEDSSLTRTEVMDAMLWCMGAVFSKSKFCRN